MERLPFVSIVIPAFNEQETVGKSIECALAQDYPEYEVIVVDDGSSDFTALLIEHPEVKSIHMERNQGKAAAVNAAIEEAKGEYILFSDSDSHLHQDALRRLVGHFADPGVGAVCGQLLVRRVNKLIVLWQTVEYMFSQAVVKIAQNGSGSSVTVCPGPICMYERRLLLTLGGFKSRTIVEDFDMTLEVAKAGKKALYEPTAIAWTSTPESFRALKNQRVRWYHGNLQTFGIYKRMFFNPKAGMLGCFWLPYLYLWGFGGALIESALIVTAVPFFLHHASLPLGLFGLSLYLLFESVTIAIYLMVLGLERDFSPRLILAACTMKPYNLFLTWVRMVAIYREIRNEKTAWKSE